MYLLQELQLIIKQATQLIKYLPCQLKWIGDCMPALCRMKVTSVKLTRLSVLKKINGSHLGIQYIHQCCQLPAAEMNIRFI